jgi:hypothetical protein
VIVKVSENRSVAQGRNRTVAEEEFKDGSYPYFQTMINVKFLYLLNRLQTLTHDNKCLLFGFMAGINAL